MKKYLFLVIFMLSQCSVVVDPKTAFLDKAVGDWKLTAFAVEWLTDTANLTISASEGSSVTISSDGSFTISPASFAYVEADNAGLQVIYSIESAGEIKGYIGIGFNSDYDILIDPTLYTSSTITSSENGSVFLTK